MLNQAFPLWEKMPVAALGKVVQYSKSIRSARTLRKIDVAMRKPPNDSDADLLALRLLGGYLNGTGHALERIYVGAGLIARLHPHVYSVSLRVLKAFAFLPETFTFRDMRHDLERMVNVQNRRVTWSNLPPRFHNHRGWNRLCENIPEVFAPAARGTLEELCPAGDDACMVSIQKSLLPGEERWKHSHNASP